MKSWIQRVTEHQDFQEEVGKHLNSLFVEKKIFDLQRHIPDDDMR